MNYLSNQSLSKITPRLLFVQPYHEGKKNIAVALYAKEISNRQRSKHLLVGLVLCVPLINTVALLILRKLQSRGSVPSQASKSNDIPFTFWPSNKPMPKLLKVEVCPYKISLEQFSQQFIDHLFNTHIEEQDERKYSVILETDGKLMVKHKGVVVPLDEVLENVNWKNLDEKWQKLDDNNLEYYLKHSVIFERLQPKNPFPFDESKPFIWLYTSHGFYSWLNPLLRNGQIRSGLLPTATPQTNTLLLQKNAEIVNTIAKELLFISISATANLNSLSSSYNTKFSVTRMAHLPKALISEIEHKEIIEERGFLSASEPGGGFAGGGPCDEDSCRVKFIIHSKNGKCVNSFSLLKESEVLFRPFTKFKVLKFTGSQTSGFRVELKEVEE